MSENIFFMVHRSGGKAPSVRHATKALATAEAERLARELPGVRFFVLKAVSVSVVDQPAITRGLHGCDPGVVEF